MAHKLPNAGQQKKARKKLPRHIAKAIKSGWVPTVREWRGLPYDELTRAERNMAYCEKYCMVPEGTLRGQPVRLALFQEVFFYSVFDSPVRVRRAYLCMARKNGKTALIALILLCFIAGPEAVQNSRLSSGAHSKEQAAEVFNYASKMIYLSPALTSLTRVVESGKRIFGLRKNVEYKALSAEGKTNHGGSPLVAILDEMGQETGPSNDFVDAIETSQGAYEGEAILFAITTQAPTDAAMFSKWLDAAENGGDMSVVSHCYAADEDCELDDPQAHQDANPALGIFNSKSNIEGAASDAMANPSAEARFRVLQLNQRQNMVQALFSKNSWKACGASPLPLGDGVVYGGLDLSKTTDLTALVLTTRVKGVLQVHCHFWMPKDTIKQRAKEDHADYVTWAKMGLITLTDGPVVDFAFLARDVLEHTRGLNLKKLAFDDWKMDRLLVELNKLGHDLPLENWRQGYKSMSPAIDGLEEDVLKQDLAHGNNPVLGMCVHNAVALPDPAGNRKLDKSRSTGRIDGLQALAMARGVEAKVVIEEANVYEERGLRTL